MSGGKYPRHGPSSHGLLFRYIVGGLEVNYLDILSSVLGRTISTFCQKLTENILGISSAVSRRIILIFCPASSGEISRHFVKRFTENVFDILWPFHGDYLDILSSIFGLIISTLC